MAGQDEAITVCKMDTTEWVHAFDQIDKAYDKLGNRIQKIEQNQQSWSGVLLKNLDAWLGRIVSVKSALSGLVGALREAAQANRTLLDQSTDTTLHRREAFEDFQRWTGIQAGTPAYDKAYGDFSRLAEQYGAPAGMPQVARLAGEMISQNFDVKDMMGPEGWLEQAIQFSISTGKWQKGDMGAATARTTGKTLTGFGLPHTGANIARLGEDFYSVRESALTGEGLDRFADDAPAIHAMTGDDLESAIGTFSVLADVQKESRGSTALKNITQYLVTAGAFKKKTKALESLGFAPKDMDLIEARLNPKEGSSQEETEVSQRSAIAIVMQRLADAKKRVPPQTFNTAMAQVFGQQALSSANVLIEAAESGKTERRLAQTHAPNKSALYREGIDPYMKSPQAMLYRSREMVARQMDNPEAVRISGAAEFAKAAALKRKVPAIHAEDFREKFLQQMTSVMGKTDITKAMQAAAEGEQPLDAFFGDVGFGRFFKDISGTQYRKELRESAAEALKHLNGDLSFSPTTHRNSAIGRAMEKLPPASAQQLLVHSLADADPRLQKLELGEVPGAGDELAELATRGERMLRDVVPARFLQDGKLDQRRLSNLMTSHFFPQGAALGRKIRRDLDLSPDIEKYEKNRAEELDSQTKQIETIKKKPASKDRDDYLKRLEHLRQEYEKGSSLGPRRSRGEIQRDSRLGAMRGGGGGGGGAGSLASASSRGDGAGGGERSLSALVDAIASAVQQPQRVILDYGGPMIAPRKSVLGVAMGCVLGGAFGLGLAGAVASTKANASQPEIVEPDYEPTAEEYKRWSELSGEFWGAKKLRDPSKPPGTDFNDNELNRFMYGAGHDTPRDTMPWDVPLSNRIARLARAAMHEPVEKFDEGEVAPLTPIQAVSEQIQRRYGYDAPKDPRVKWLIKESVRALLAQELEPEAQKIFDAPFTAGTGSRPKSSGAYAPPEEYRPDISPPRDATEAQMADMFAQWDKAEETPRAIPKKELAAREAMIRRASWFRIYQGEDQEFWGELLAHLTKSIK